MREYFEFVNVSAVLGSVLLGLLVGAFYGFTMVDRKPIVYPYALWIVGLGFVVLLGVNVVLQQQGTWPFVFARGTLWTVLCACIPIGRYVRVRWEDRKIARRIGLLRGRR